MNKLQQFIASKPMGFLNGKPEVAELAAIDRLCKVLVRCGGCRFLCSAQDYAHLSDCISAGGDYVRDVSFPVGAMESAAAWQPELVIPHTTPVQRTAILALAKSNDAKRNARSSWRADRHSPHFNENDCGGAFDGNQVTSDADPGL